MEEDQRKTRISIITFIYKTRLLFFPEQYLGRLVMTVRVKIKKGDFGMTYTFTIEDVDLSTHTVKLYVWRGDTKLIDGHACTPSKVGSDTVVTYAVASGDFPTVGVWDAELEFTTSTTYKERTETFEWEVLEDYPA